MPTKRKDEDGGAGAATAGKPAAPTKAKPKVDKKNATQELPPYHVVLLNDDDHSYEYVVEMLKAVCGHPEEMGFKLAKCVDVEGRAVVMTTHKEKAELKREQIHSYGTDPRVATCRGSMTAIIQAAEG